MDKQKTINEAINILQERLDKHKQTIKKIQLDIASETKSSAGDKFETAREMMKQEEQKIAKQVYDISTQINTLEALDKKEHQIIQNGSIVTTDKGIFYIGAAIGQLNLPQQSIMFISMDAPIFSLLKDKKKGDYVTFNTTTFNIFAVY